MKYMHAQRQLLSSRQDLLWILRMLLWPLLTAWTLIWLPELWPMLLLASLLLLSTQIGRKLGRWPLPGNGGVLLDLSIAVWMPLLTGGWNSPWIVDGLLVLVWIGLYCSRRAGTIATCAWLLLSPALIQYHDPQYAWSSAVIAFAVPVLIWLIVGALHYAQAKNNATLPNQLSHIYQRLLQAQQLAQTSDIPELRRLLKSSTEELQHLLPPVAPQQTAIAQAQTFVQAWQKTTGIELELTLAVHPRTLPAVVQSILLRALKETLHNIQQHAHASFVEVDLRSDDDTLVLTVRDDGVGLLHSPLQRPGCHGLRSLRYRVQEINGSLDVFEGVAGGVVVQVAMPLTVYAL